MKNTKKYVLGLLALLIGASAQTSLSQIKVRVLPAHKAKQRAAPEVAPEVAPEEAPALPVAPAPPEEEVPPALPVADIEAQRLADIEARKQAAEEAAQRGIQFAQQRQTEKEESLADERVLQQQKRRAADERVAAAEKALSSARSAFEKADLARKQAASREWQARLREQQGLGLLEQEQRLAAHEQKRLADVDKVQEQFSWGLASRQGERRTMEDDHDNRIMGSQAFFGVYDGHGGANAAKYTTKNLYNNFLAEKGTIPNRLIQAFEKTDQQIQNSMNDGTTAVAAFINGDKAYIANAGDARALIIRNGKIITATKDHKPNDPVEKARIEREDGLVWRGRVGGRLAVARALGDKGIIGVSATPDIYEQTLQNGDIIVLACDGLWDVMTNKQVAQLVHTAVQKQRAETLSAPGRWESVTDDGNADLMGAISRMLRDRAYDAGSRDNISVMVIQIKL